MSSAEPTSVTAEPPEANSPDGAKGPPAHGGLDSARHELIHIFGTLFPLAGGFALYGWRALAMTALVISSAWLALRIWRSIGRRGAAMRLPQIVWLAILVSLMLPAHLLSSSEMAPLVRIHWAWTALPAAGLLLVMMTWLSGGSAWIRLHPAAATYLLLAAALGSLLTPHVVLHRDYILSGDILRFDLKPDTTAHQSGDLGWIHLREKPSADAIYVQHTAAEHLSQYTRGSLSEQAWLPVEGLLRDAMPPLEDLVIGGHPGPIGASSAIAVLIGGLFLVYRGVIDYRIPLFTILTAFATTMVLPVPVVISEGHVPWLPLVMPRTNLDWATIVTFANYQVMASPLLLMAFFLATSATICPAEPRARVAYAMLLGLLTAVAQLYVSCSLGPYLALLTVAGICPWLEERSGRAPVPSADREN